MSSLSSSEGSEVSLLSYNVAPQQLETEGGEDTSLSYDVAEQQLETEVATPKLPWKGLFPLYLVIASDAVALSIIEAFVAGFIVLKVDMCEKRFNIAPNMVGIAAGWFLIPSYDF